jgi:hypothetical protein
MAMNERVLIGFADSLAAIESAWSLIDAGFEVVAFERSTSRSALRLVSTDQVRVVTVTSPEYDADACVTDLAALISDLHPTAVLPLDDISVWACDAVASQVDGSKTELPTVFVGPLDKLALLALDKREQFAAARSAGLAVPPTVDCAELDANSLFGADRWMVKPALAVQLNDGRVQRKSGRAVCGVAEARGVAARIGGPAVAQPLIAGTGEGVFGLAARGGILAWSAHQRIRMMNPQGSGSSACRSIPLSDQLVGPVTDFISATGWQGLFMIELLRDRSGQPWFMELNGRTWGSMALARKRGFDYPTWAVRAALNPEYTPDVPQNAAHLTARHLGREVVHLAAVLASGTAPRLATTRAVLTLHRDDCWYNWRKGEARVFFSDSWATLRKQFGGKLTAALRKALRLPNSRLQR